MPGAVDPQELLVRAMIGQQITVAAARTALAQLSAAGSESLFRATGCTGCSPRPPQIAETGFELLRGPQRRTDSVRAAAAAMASGDLDFGYGDDLPGLGAKLLPLAGVGPWTVGYVAMRVIGAPDVFLANDAAVRNGIRRSPWTRPAGTGPESTPISGNSARGAPTPPCTSGGQPRQRRRRPLRTRARQTHSKGSEDMKAQLLTMSTPDGPFTIIARDGVVLASGWTAAPANSPARSTRSCSRRVEPVRAGLHLRGRGGVLCRQSGPGHGGPGAAEVGPVPQPRLGHAADRGRGAR